MEKNLGHATAYGYAKSKGYSGTEEEFAQLMADYASVGQSAAQSAEQSAASATSASASAQTASQAAQTATEKASEAVTAAGTATTKASEASQSASTASAAASSAGTSAQTATTAAATATTKASEASESATTATTAKTDAETARDAAAQSASEAAESARTLTIDQTLTQSGQAADAKVVGDEISDLKEDLSQKFPVVPINTVFFDDLNYGVPENVEFVHEWVDATGTVKAVRTATNSLIVNVEPSTKYWIFAPSMNRANVIESSTDFVVESTYTCLHANNGTSPYYVTTGATAKKIMVYFYSGSYDYEANKNSIFITKDNYNPSIQPKIKNEYLDANISDIKPKDTTFFTSINYFEIEKAVVYTDRFVNVDGAIIAAPSDGTVNTLVFPVKPNTDYYLYIPNNNRGVIAENANDQFVGGLTYNVLYTSVKSANYYQFTTSANGKYVAVYFYKGDYDYDTNKNNIVLNIDRYTGSQPPYIPFEYLPTGFKDVLEDTNVLIFGDSISDTCNFTINSSDETSAMTWKNPSNSYVDAGGTIIQYSMWPKILKDSQNCQEVRNYARQGASYKTSTRTAGEERQNLQYQIDVALNDLDNPNNVFEVDDFAPDIVIFALGTNDGAPNDTYDSAMNKTVLVTGTATVDVDATLANLDETKFCESARKAFLRIKKAFPMAQVFCVLPIQRAGDETNTQNLHTYLKQMAERYGCIIIDGTFSCGIIRELNVASGLGTYLKDGLHPNEKGQNLLARTIIKAIKTHYMPFGKGFN